MLKLLIPLTLLAAPIWSQAPTIDGTWSARVGGYHAVLLLDSRADGSILGVLPGEPTVWIDGGSISGSDVTINFSGEDGGGAISAFSFTGTISGDILDGVALVDGVLTPVTLNRVATSYAIEHWAIYDTTLGLPIFLNRVGQPSSTSSGGSSISTFRGGGFAGHTTCDFVACGGMIDDWIISGDDHTINLVAGGSCSAAATLTATWDDAEQMMVGTWSSSNCAISTSGDFMGGKIGAAYSADISRVLTMLANFADAVEAESTTALDAFHPAYLDDGTAHSDWATTLAGWYADYDNLVVELGAVKRVITYLAGDEILYLKKEPQINCDITISGEPSSGGPAEEFFTFSPADDFATALSLIGTSGGNSVFVGNGASTAFSLRLPILASDIHPDGNRIWPYGAHGGGHPEGHPGSDFFLSAGSYAYAIADGTIAAILTNPTWAGQVTIFLELSADVVAQYDHIDELTLLVGVGDSVSEGDILAEPALKDPPGMPPMYVIHIGLRSGMDTASALEDLNTAGQAEFDLIWPDAAWPSELSEPLTSNQMNVTFPHTVSWSLVSGSLAARIEFVDLEGEEDDLMDNDYEYLLYDSTGALVESGTTISVHRPGGLSELDLIPVYPTTGPTKYCALKIISEQMWIDWDTVSRPTTLSSASEYSFDGP